MNIKTGVNTKNCSPQIWYATGVAEQVYHRYGYEFTITSMRDGTHFLKSKHYSGNAFDCRTRHLSLPTARLIFMELRKLLDPFGFDTVDEMETKSHIHVEFDPKAGEEWLTTVS